MRHLMKFLAPALTCLVLAGLAISAHAENVDPLQDPSTQVVTSTTVTQDFERGGANTAARPGRLEYNSVGPWTAWFTTHRVSFNSGTDILFRSGTDAEIRIDIRRTSDVASVAELRAAVFARATEGRSEVRDIRYADPSAASGFTFVERTERGKRQVFYAVMRLPSAPQEHTIVARGEWPFAQRVGFQRDAKRILGSLRFSTGAP